MDGSRAAQNPEDIKEPNHHADDHHGIQNLLNFPIHRYVVVDQPEKNSDDNQGNDDLDEHNLI